jgi:hypothetical protein
VVGYKSLGGQAPLGPRLIPGASLIVLPIPFNGWCAMPDDVAYVSSQAFKIDDIRYSIGVYKNDAGYLAFCDCHKCTTHDMKSAHTADKAAAVKECEELIRQHHADHHSAAA